MNSSKHLEPYRHPSMRIYTQLKDEALSRIRYYDRVEPNELVAELRRDKVRMLEWLEQRKREGYFADEALCNGDSGWTDMKSYHEDEGMKCFESAQEQRELREFALTQNCSKGALDEIDKEFIRQTRFAYAHFKKAGGINWRQRARIKEALIQQGVTNDNDGYKTVGSDGARQSRTG